MCSQRGKTIYVNEIFDRETEVTAPGKGTLRPIGSLVDHFGAATNLARWLLRSKSEAEDAVQDAYLRALRYFKNFRGEDGRTWLMRIVRNCCYDRVRRRVTCRWTLFDEQIELGFASESNPEVSIIREERFEQLRT